MFFLFSLFDIFFNYSLIRSALVCTLVYLSMHTFNLKKSFSFKKKSNLRLPPGPLNNNLPFFGYLPFLKKNSHLQFFELSKTYGPIFQLKLASTRVVVITSSKLVREAFRQSVFSGRPSNELTKILKGFGVVNSNGELWREQRSFIHSVLKEFGARSMANGKVGLEKIINDEIQSLVKDIKKLEGKTFIRPKLHKTVTNIVCYLLMGFRFKTEEDKNFKRLIELMDEGFKLLNVTMISNFFPFTRHLPYISQTFQKIKKNHAESGNYFKRITEEHRNTLDPFNIRDVCDAYIKEQDRIKAGGRKSYFSDKQLVQIMNDMFSAGLETVANTLDWSMLFLVLYPEVQYKIQEEIDKVIGSNRLPELNDLQNMPYTEATMMEVMRRSSIVALGHVHTALNDAELGGFLIPKNTHILSNLYGIHMDPNNWDNPEKFDPTRFLTIEGKLNKSENFMPFSAGRRMCLGDVLTKMEFFLFLTNILLNFNVVCDDHDKPSLEVFCATIIFPKPFGLRFVSRKIKS